MSRIVVCYKWVADEADIRINPDRSIDTSRCQYKISDYDRNAIEASMRIAAGANEVVTLSYGTAAIQKSTKDALSRGPAAAHWIDDPGATVADGRVTANALAAGIGKIGDVGLVVCAEGASDTYAHEVGPRIGVLLGLPVVSNVISAQIDGDTLIARRQLADCIEAVKVKLPAVITVLPSFCEAPIPGLKMVLAASKKPVTRIAVDELGLAPDRLTAKMQVSKREGYVMSRRNIMFSGDLADQVKQLADRLSEEGLLQ